MGDLAQTYEQWLLGMWHAPDDELDDRAADLADDDLVVHNGRHVLDVRGPQALARVVRSARGFYDDTHVTLDVGPVVDGELVAARWTFTGSYAGGLPGATAPTGTHVTLVGMDVMRVVDGRIVEYWALSVAADMMDQLTG